MDYDATVAEINPLGLMDDGRLVALDCHLEVDDDAVSRHADIAAMEKDTGRVEGERRMSDFERLAANIDNLDHRGVAGRVIEFDGNLGLIIGGGGASLTAFDAIRAHGGRPANYCEVGGNPSVLKVKELTRLILSKPGVDKIAVIMNVVSNTRVDMMARGIVKGIRVRVRIRPKRLPFSGSPGPGRMRAKKYCRNMESRFRTGRSPSTRLPGSP